MRRLSWLGVVVTLAAAACSGPARQPGPFDLTEATLTVLADWQAAGMSCSDPADAASPEIEACLLDGGGADGTMPTTEATQIGRASIASDEDGHPVIYLTPLGSSMLVKQPD